MTVKKNLTPGIKSTFCKRLPLKSAAGAVTGKELAMPPSIGLGQEFKIGNVRMRRDHKQVQALDPIPASWFVDLTEAMPVEHGA